MTEIEADKIITGVFMSLENTTEEEATAFATATIALREQAARINPKPLTLDELRERDGKPVWVEEITPEQIDGNYWGIVDVDFVCPGSLGIGAIISTATDGKSKFAITPFSDYNKTHVAYDYPPKEDKPQ